MSTSPNSLVFPPTHPTVTQVGEATEEFLIWPSRSEMLRRNGIDLAGVSRATPEFQFTNPVRVCLQIMVTFRGHGRVLVGGRWEECHPGQAYVTPQGKCCAYRGESGWEVGWITFAPDWHPLEEEPFLQTVNPDPLRHALYGFYHDMESRQDSPSFDHWAELLRCQADDILGERKSSRLGRTWKAVQNDLARPWTLAELARQAGLGQESLRQHCLRETGVSPMRHVSRLRLQAALPLLRKGMKIEAVAQSVGYGGPYAFSTAFKRQMGRPPSDFRC